MNLDCYILNEKQKKKVFTLTWVVCGKGFIHYNQRLGHRLDVHHHHHHEAVEGERVAWLARLQALQREGGRKERLSFKITHYEYIRLTAGNNFSHSLF